MDRATFLCYISCLYGVVKQHFWRFSDHNQFWIEINPSSENTVKTVDDISHRGC